MTDIYLSIPTTTGQADVMIDKNGKLVMSQGTPITKQKVFLLLKTQQGDYFYDVNAGIPYLDFFRGDIDASTFFVLLYDKLQSLRGVQSVKNLKINEHSNRDDSITASIVDDQNNLIELI